jgi:hypothetical protein
MLNTAFFGSHRRALGRAQRCLSTNGVQEGLPSKLGAVASEKLKVVR